MHDHNTARTGGRRTFFPKYLKAFFLVRATASRGGTSRLFLLITDYRGSAAADRRVLASTMGLVGPLGQGGG